MALTGRTTGMILVAALALSACAKGEPKLMQLRSTGTGPDEFAILPTKPIEMPKNFASLPPPTPGGVNRTDQQPRAEAIAALGGRDRGVNSQVPASDGALVTAASRYGVTANIRETLAREDYEFRDKNRGRLLERLFGKTVYYQSYAPMSLDQYAELERLRRLGIRAPAAPPDPAEFPPE